MTDLDDIVGYNLKRAYMVFNEDFKAVESLDGISPRQYAVLSLVAAKENATQSALALKLGIERSGMVKLVDELEKMALVERVPVATDRRKYALRTTALGRKKQEQYRSAIVEHEAALLADFSADERRQFMGFLNRIQAR